MKFLARQSQLCMYDSVHLVQWVVYFFNCLESTYGCYPTKWQFGQKPFFIIINLTCQWLFDFFSLIMQLWTYDSYFFRSGECGNNVCRHSVLLPVWDRWQSALGSEFSTVNHMLFRATFVSWSTSKPKVPVHSKLIPSLRRIIFLNCD